MSNEMREQWIEEVMGSTRGMAKAAPGDGFFEQVSMKLKRPGINAGRPVALFKWVAAAVLLLALNAGSIAYFMDHGNKHAGGNLSNPLAAQMQTESTYNY
jgi:hypothetical protein